MRMSDQGFLSGFVGEFLHSLDPKKRLTIPSEWRSLVGEPNRLLIMPGVDVKCLYAFPAKSVERRMEAIRNLSVSDVDGRRFARIVASRSDFLWWDSQGRIRISDKLLEYAELQNQAVLVGNFEGFELWNPDRWTDEAKSIDDDMLKKAASSIGF
jgi:MraZ protein